MTVDLVQANGAKPKPSAADLAKAITRGMADHWEATADRDFTRLPKKHLLDEIGDILIPERRKQIEAMKRETMALAVTKELKGKRWLPVIMRGPA